MYFSINLSSVSLQWYLNTSDFLVFTVLQFFKKSYYRVLQYTFFCVNNVSLLSYLFFCYCKAFFFFLNSTQSWMGRKEERNFTFWISYFFIVFVSVIPSFIVSLWTMNSVVCAKCYFVCKIFFFSQWERPLWFKQIIMVFTGNNFFKKGLIFRNPL